MSKDKCEKIEANLLQTEKKDKFRLQKLTFLRINSKFRRKLLIQILKKLSKWLRI